ncbi:hypothetical protein LIN78_11215 [Leeia sp. TBRC 13508]|uniref:Ankyrin repeat protein n=1 Tax=Leeia speluncae TaxID=2884804 RepID=A0ABS8D7D4_9NEIS|nr:hypothetical protein [Leeia speluncae]MCB6184115.1 hypothetical protein [Leeia speluncae]
MNSKRLGAWLIFITSLLSCQSLQAFDLDIILTGAQAEKLPIAEQEKVIAVLAEKNGSFALTRFGHHLYFFSRFNGSERVWQSAPLSGINENCPTIYRASSTSHLLVVQSNLCPASTTDTPINNWYFDELGHQAQIAPEQKDTAGIFLEQNYLPLLQDLIHEKYLPASYRLIALDNQVETRTYEWKQSVMNLTQKQFTSDIPLLRQGINWRATNIPASLLEKAGSALMASDDCNQLEDSAAIISTVLSQNPQTAEHYFQLANTLSKAKEKQCRPTGSRAYKDRLAQYSQAQIDELYRQYCQKKTFAKLSKAERTQLAKRLRIKELAASSCRPLFDLFRAIEQQDITQLKAAIADPENDLNAIGPHGYSALHDALNSNWKVGALVLIEAGADVNRVSENNNSGNLLKAVYLKDTDLIKALIGHGANTVIYGEATKPLSSLVGMQIQNATDEAFQTEMFDLFLANHANLHERQSGGQTLLQSAVNGGAALSMLDRLKSSGTYLNETEQFGRNAAFFLPPFASRKDRAINALNWLIQNGINLHQQDTNGNTPLNYLFQYSHADTETIEALASIMIEHGAPPLLSNNEGKIPLYYAALRPSPLLVSQMLKHIKTPDLATILLPIQQKIKERIANLQSQRTPPSCGCVEDLQTVDHLLNQQIKTSN